MSQPVPLTDDELDAIERRSEAASPGPWQSFIEGRDHLGGDNFIRVGGLDDNEDDMYVSRATPGQGLTPVGDHDLDFIAHARQDSHASSRRSNAYAPPSPTS
ncbi:hypothetical protein ACWDGI_39320 [Streptomyces sp. NPDC001220]